jgi:tetratricopeptide (TPR) repeat protein
MLNYKPRNKEINLLYLAFSNLTKTIKVARNSLYEGDDNQALIGYHEVAQIFRQLDNQQKLGMCMNNLGCIYLKKDSFEIANEYLQKSIEIQEAEQQNKKVNNKDELTNQFVKACRLYNKGLVNYKYILKLIKEYVPNYSMSSFVKSIPN